MLLVSIYTVCSFLFWIIHPRLGCVDSLQVCKFISASKDLRAVTLTFGLVCHRVSGSVGSQACKSGDSACFSACFLLGHCSLPLVATSCGCPRLTCLYHERDEGFAVYFAGGGTPVRGWPHYFHFQVNKII